MRISLILLLLSCRSLAMPYGSYLVRPTNTRQGVVRQYRTEPKVRSAYDQVLESASEVLRSLRQKRLTKSHVMLVFYNHNGELGYHVRKVRRGSKVWVSPDGTPILMVRCGNPIRTRPVPFGSRYEEPEVPTYNEDHPDRTPGHPYVPPTIVIPEIPYQPLDPIYTGPTYPIHTSYVTPEPSGIQSLVIGLLTLGGVYVRRRRKQA